MSYLDTVWLLLVTAIPGATSINNHTILSNIYLYIFILCANIFCILLFCFLTVYFLSYSLSQNVDYATFTFLSHSYSWLTLSCENLNTGIRNAVDSKYFKIRIKTKLNNLSIKPKQQKEMIQITGIPIDL